MGEDARCVGAPSKAILILVRNSTFIIVYTPEQVINCKIFLFLSPNKKLNIFQEWYDYYPDMESPDPGSRSGI